MIAQVGLISKQQKPAPQRDVVDETLAVEHFIRRAFLFGGRWHRAAKNCADFSKCPPSAAGTIAAIGISQHNLHTRLRFARYELPQHMRAGRARDQHRRLG